MKKKSKTPKSADGKGTAERLVVNRDKKKLVPADMIAACRNGRLQKVRKYIEAGASINGLPVPSEGGDRPLTAAAAGGHLQVIKLLLEMGADVNPEDAWLKRPLSAAAARGHLSVVKLLLDRGADINPSRQPRSAITCAAENGHLSVVEELLARGVDPKKQRLPDPLVQTIGRDHHDVAYYLLDYGWPVIDEAMSQALHRADVKMVKRLIAAGAKCTLDHLYHAIQRGKEDEVRELLRAGAPLWPRRKDEFMYPLHIAASKGLVKAVQAMIAAGADLDRRGNLDMEELLPDPKKPAGGSVRRHASKKWCTSRQTTALIVAVRCKQKPIVELLLKNGAKPGATDGDGMTPLAWAKKLGRTGMIPLLAP